MACSGQRFWLVLASLVLLGTGCFGDANIDDATPAALGVDLNDPVEAFDFGYDPHAVLFEVRLSEVDKQALGAPGTAFEREPGRLGLIIDTKFQSSSVSGDDPGPCLADDVIVTNLDTGEEFVAIEAGHCIENQWVYTVEGAYDYLIDAGPCTGTVVLDEGRELEVACR